MTDFDSFYVRQLSEFIGQKITGVVTSPVNEFGQEFFGFRIGDRVIWFLCDDEGNEPGSFEIQTFKE